MYGCIGGSSDLLRKNDKDQLLTANKESRVIRTKICHRDQYTII